MKRHLFAFIVTAGFCFAVASGQTITDPAHIEVYVTPFYNSKGPTIEVGPFGSGLAAKNESEFVATIAKMKKSWDTLNFPETYAAAIRLYDLGYRKESIYWFYSAQYRGRLFASLIDRDKMGSMGDAGFELFQAQNAFQQLVGPYVNGYAFGDIDQLIPIIQRVQTKAVSLVAINCQLGVDALQQVLMNSTSFEGRRALCLISDIEKSYDCAVVTASPALS